MKLQPSLLVLLPALSLALAAHAATITTTFTGINNFDGNMFDVTVGSNALSISSVNVNVDTGPSTIDVYIKTGSYTTDETNPAAWTLEAATPVIGAGMGNSTLVTFNPFTLAANTLYGMYVTIDTNENNSPYMYYSNINGTTVVSNPDLSLSFGIGEGGKFGSLGVFNNREWNGSINYSALPAVSATPEPGSLLLSLTGISGAFLAARRRIFKR